MKPFKEFQFGWLIFIFVVPAQLLITYFYIFHVGSKPIDTSSYILANFAFVLVYLLFYGLTTTIDNNTLVVSFGIGLIKKKIDISSIISFIQNICWLDKAAVESNVSQVGGSNVKGGAGK